MRKNRGVQPILLLVLCTLFGVFWTRWLPLYWMFAQPFPCLAYYFCRVQFSGYRPIKKLRCGTQNHCTFRHVYSCIF